MMIRTFLLFCFSLAIVPPGLAEAHLDFSLYRLKDPGRPLELREVLAAPEPEWEKVPAREARIGYSAHRQWLEVVPTNEATFFSRDTLVLTIPYIFLNRASLYLVHGQAVKAAFHRGLGIPMAERKGDFRMAGAYTYRLPPPHLEEARYLLSVEGNFPLFVPLELSTAQHFASRHRDTQFVIGLFFGCLILAFLFNGFLALALRSPLYRDYAAFVAGMIFYYMGHEGLSVQLLWPDSPWWAERETHVTGAFTLVFYVFFVRRFLLYSVTAPRLDRILLLLMGVSVLRSAWMAVFPSSALAAAGEGAALFCYFTILVMAVVGLKNGVRSAKLFLLSSFLFNLAVVLYILQSADLVYFGRFVEYAPHAGTLLEVIFLSFALADRIRITTNDLRRTNRRLDREIRERVDAEKKLERQSKEALHSEKMGALGRMAGGIAHEINNPLAIIQGNASLLRKIAEGERSDPAKVAEIAFTIEQTSSRISRIMKSMRALSRDSRNDPMESCSLGGILADTYALSRERFEAAGIRLAIPELKPDLNLNCRGAEICQVLVNLLNNAHDAVEGCRERWVEIAVEVDVSLVRIAVTDSGPGIPPEVREKIQEPFFTTKEVGRGTGLGLSISQTIMRNHGGALYLDTQFAHTRFVVELPKGGL